MDLPFGRPFPVIRGREPYNMEPRVQSRRDSRIPIPAFRNQSSEDLFLQRGYLENKYPFIFDGYQ
jgi:hypothetical protein